MTASISTLPVWKKNGTAAEFLQEVAGLALERPERFSRVVVIFEKVNEDGQPIETRHHCKGIKSNTDLICTLETTKLEVFEFMKGRR